MLDRLRGSCGKMASGKNVKVPVATFVKSVENKAEESGFILCAW